MIRTRPLLAIAAGLVLPCLLGLVGALVLSAMIAASGSAAAGDATQFEIENALTCQCGCGLTVHACNHLNCSSGIPLKQEIAARITAGGTREEIVAYFERKYGEKILSAPTTRGFNLAAWTVPFFAIGLGGAAIAFVLARWRRNTPVRAGAAGTAPPAAMDPALRARLDAALDEFDKRA